MAYNVRTLVWPEDREALFAHFHRVHGPVDTELLGAWYGRFPGFDPQNAFVIDGDDPGEIAGHALLIPRHLRIGASTLPTAELGVIGVDDAYAQRNLLHLLLDAAHDCMTERGDALGLMFGLPAVSEYWQYEYAVGLYLTSYESSISTDALLKAGGWDMAHSYERRTADRLGTHNRPVTVRRCYENDLPAIDALYTAESARGHYLIARNAETWSWQLDYLTRIGRNEPDDFLVAEIDGRLVAYARLVTQGTVNWFRESDAAPFSVIEAAGEQPDAIEALLGEIGRIAQTFGADRVGLYVHPESAFVRHVLARGACLCDFTGAGMIRLHNLGAALDYLAPALETRRLASPYMARAYHLQITTEHERAALQLGVGDAELVEVEAPSSVVARLLTGWYGIDQLSNGFHERYADLLRALFPRRDPKIALADLL